jgi:hypothetical protein
MARVQVRTKSDTRLSGPDRLAHKVGVFHRDRKTPLPVMKLEFAADLRVGVAAVNTAMAAFKAEFDGLEITP